jgi:hypothetical protein
VDRRILSTQVVEDKHAESLMIVAQQRICARVTSDSQCVLRGVERQWKYGDGFKRSSMLCQGAVVGNEGDVEA